METLFTADKKEAEEGMKEVDEEGLTGRNMNKNNKKDIDNENLKNNQRISENLITPPERKMWILALVSCILILISFIFEIIAAYYTNYDIVAYLGLIVVAPSLFMLSYIIIYDLK